MGMTAFYGDFDRATQEPESLKTIARALELGINFLDTAWVYQSYGNGGGNYTNEELVGKAIKIHGREKFVIATKFGIILGPNGRQISNSEETIRSQLADSLRRLDTDYIDLYYAHRIDQDIPIENTMQVLKSLVEEGKIRYIGLSECTAEELRRAHSIYPVTAIQMEYSIQTRDIEATLLPVAKELGVTVVAYSPLGRGFLADLSIFDNLGASDARRNLPRFSGDNLNENKRRVERFFALAEKKKCTPAQLALAWVHSQGAVPIPGTKSSSRIEENAAAYALLPLTKEELHEIESVVEGAVGDRYPASVRAAEKR